MPGLASTRCRANGGLCRCGGADDHRAAGVLAEEKRRRGALLEAAGTGLIPWAALGRALVERPALAAT